jgi:hypothetical protein
VRSWCIDASLPFPTPWRNPVVGAVETTVGPAGAVDVVAGALVAALAGVDDATAEGAGVADEAGVAEDAGVAVAGATVEVIGTSVGEATIGVAVVVATPVANGVRDAVATVVASDPLGVGTATVTVAEGVSGFCVGTTVGPVVALYPPPPASAPDGEARDKVAVGATVPLMVVGVAEPPWVGVAVATMVGVGEPTGVTEKVAVATAVRVGVTVAVGAVSCISEDEALTRPLRSYATTTAL